jgi:hypothetical protein
VEFLIRILLYPLGSDDCGYNYNKFHSTKTCLLFLQEVRTEFDGGRSNLVGLIEVHKLVVADDIMDSKKSADVEKDVNAISGRVEQVDKILHEQETK